MYYRPILGLKESQEAIQVMIEEIESKKDYYWQHGVFAIVDYWGSLIAFARMDGVGQQGAHMAIRKAYTSALWGRTIEEFRNIVKSPMDVASFGPNYTLCLGGIPILPPDKMKESIHQPYVVGAIGVACAGPEMKDHEVAMVGVKYLESVLWP